MGSAQGPGGFMRPGRQPQGVQGLQGQLGGRQPITQGTVQRPSQMPPAYAPGSGHQAFDPAHVTQLLAQGPTAGTVQRPSQMPPAYAPGSGHQAFNPTYATSHGPPLQAMGASPQQARLQQQLQSAGEQLAQRYTPSVGDVTGGVANVLNAREMALNAPTPGAQMQYPGSQNLSPSYAPDISYLVGNVAQNLQARNMAMQGPPQAPSLASLRTPQAPTIGQLQSAGQQALAGGAGAPTIADLIRMVRQVRGVG